MDVMTENKLVPKLRFMQFTDELSKNKLSEFSDKISDGIHSTPKYNDEGNYFFVNGNNLIRGKIVISKSTKKVDEIEFEKHKRLLNNRTILLSINGTIGNIAFYNNEPIILGKSACYINLNESIKKDFIFQYIQSDIISRYFKSQLTGSTIMNLSLRTIKDTPLKLPSLPEQQKIASFLSAVDEKLQQLTKKKELLEEYKTGVMQKIFSQELRFKDDNGNNYPDWEEKMLGEFSKFHRGHSYNSTNVKDSGLLVLRSSNIKKGYLILNKDLQFVNKKCKEEIQLRYKDIVICMANGSKRLVGKSGVYLGNYEGEITVGAFCSIMRSESVLSQYILQSIQYRRYLHVLLAGTNIYNLKTSEMSELKFWIPKSDEEQQRIANFLSSLDSKIELVNTQIENTNAFKKGLLQQMFV